jgi:hypothetical protein
MAQSSPRDIPLPRAFEEERTARLFRNDPQYYEAVRGLLLSRRDARREQIESASGEAAIVMRGRCQELTSIINDLFPPMRKED